MEPILNVEGECLLLMIHGLNGLYMLVNCVIGYLILMSMASAMSLVQSIQMFPW